MLKILISLLALTTFNTAWASIQLQVIPQQAYIQEASVDNACGYKSAPTVSFHRVILHYNGGGSFFPSHLALKFSDPAFSAGQYRCVITGDNFWKMFGGKPFELKPGESISNTCPLVCGSFDASNTSNSTSLFGKGRIYGFEVDPNGNSAPIIAEVDLEVFPDLDRALRFEF